MKLANMNKVSDQTPVEGLLKILSIGYVAPSPINDLNIVSGVSDLADGYESHAFLYVSGRMRDLGLLGVSYSEALAVNDLGVAVGDSDLDG